jgi:hypothetical protein
LRVGYREGSFLISAAIARKAAAISLSFSIASLLRRDILQKVYTAALPDPRIVGRHLRPRPSARETQDSSARASSVGGTSRPSGLAVFALMTSSYLVGRITGRSAGFAPLGIRPARVPAQRYVSNYRGHSRSTLHPRRNSEIRTWWGPPRG